MFLRLLLSIFFSLISGLSVTILCVNAVSARNEYRSGKFLLYPEADMKILGVTSTDSLISFDYQKRLFNGSPLVFGGAQNPDVQQTGAWSKVAASGVTSIRIDLNLEAHVNTKTTVSNYLQNTNGVQDPANWDQKFIALKKSALNEAKINGMKRVVIMGYAPAWLTSNHKRNGVPQQWDVYEDIVRKMYKFYRNDMDYIEIWNEPTHTRFLELTGSGLNATEAYKQIATHTIKAILQASKELNEPVHVPIGGPVAHTWENQEITKAILNDPYISANLQFLSYHYYGNVDTHLDLLQKKVNTKNIPIFITEWNYSSSETYPDSHNSGSSAIAFTGAQLINFLNQGVQGANYYMLQPVSPTTPKRTEGFMGYYLWKNNIAQLLPQAKTWVLLSNTMRLGKGASKIVQRNAESDSNSVGFINDRGEFGFAVANPTDSDKNYSITANNVDLGPNLKFTVYAASSQYGGNQEVTQFFTSQQNANNLVLTVPKQTVIAVKITKGSALQTSLWSSLRKIFAL